MSSKRTFRYLVAATLLAFALAAAPARAQDGSAVADRGQNAYETAVEDYEQGAYETAYTEFQRLTNLGDARARSFLQRMREEGLLAAVLPSSEDGAADSRQGTGFGITIPWSPFKSTQQDFKDAPEWDVV